VEPVAQKREQKENEHVDIISHGDRWTVRYWTVPF
jgi:hypothetical protein